MVVALSLALTMYAAPDAEEPRVGVLPMQIEAELAAPDRRDAADHFSDGLSRSGFAIAPVRAEGADTCAAAECYQRLATDAGTPQLAGASVIQKGPDYEVRAFIVDGASGEVVVSADGVCELCGMQELDEMIEGVAARLRSKLATAVQPTRLKVDTKPDGARVTIDGREVGTTPVELEIPPGPHEIEVQREGYQPITDIQEIQPGTTGAFAYDLRRATSIPAWLPWTAIGVGAGAAVSGIVLIALDGKEIKRDCNADVDGRCEFLHDTLTGGVILTATGVAALGTGVALAIVRARRGKSPRRVEANAWLHTPGLSISGRF